LAGRRRAGELMVTLLLPAAACLLAASLRPASTPGFTPIMGWNNCQIDCGPTLPDDSLVRETALLLQRTGLANAGYRHLNLDDAWMGKRTSASGRPQPNASRFPDWEATMEFVRAQGLRLGLCECTNGCLGQTVTAPLQLSDVDHCFPQTPRPATRRAPAGPVPVSTRRSTRSSSSSGASRT
jgi:hypothetical protein